MERNISFWFFCLKTIVYVIKDWVLPFAPVIYEDQLTIPSLTSFLLLSRNRKLYKQTWNQKHLFVFFLKRSDRAKSGWAWEETKRDWQLDLQYHWLAPWEATTNRALHQDHARYWVTDAGMASRVWRNVEISESAVSRTRLWSRRIRWCHML